MLRPQFFALLSFVLFECVLFGCYLSASALPAIDLPGHIYLVSQLKAQLLALNITFYDPLWFAGWPAFQFYAPLAHFASAVLSVLLSPFLTSPEIFSVHLLSLLGLALLPFSVYFPSLELAQSVAGRSLYQREQMVMAILSGALAHWFICHADSQYGLGAKAILESGLYAQVFGWHFLLLYFGYLLRVVSADRKRDRNLLALTFGLLAVSHSLSWIFACYIAAFFVAVSFEKRIKLITSHLLGVGVAAFWLVPGVMFIGEFTTSAIEPYGGDFLEIICRYPLFEVPALISQAISEIKLSVDIMPLVVLALSIVTLITALVGKRGSFQATLVLVFLGVLIFRSEYIAASLPIGLHYYRFNALLVLILLPLLVAAPIGLVPLFSIGAAKLTLQYILGALLVFCSFLGIYSATQFRPLGISQFAESQTEQHFAVQNEVLKHLADEPGEKRVLFEYFADPKTFPILNPHYLSSELPRRYGIETVSGLTTQSSLAYQFVVVAARELGAEMYSPNLFISKPSRSDDALRVKQLIDLGITHIVAYSDEFVGRLSPYAEKVESFGPYQVLRLTGASLAPIRSVFRSVAGYVDLDGRLPFKFLEHYINANSALAQRFEMLSLSGETQIPADLRLLLMHGSQEQADRYQQRFEAALAETTIKRIPPPAPKEFEYSKINYQRSEERETYIDLASYLNKNQELLSAFLALGEFREDSMETRKPEMGWDPGFQRLKLWNLEAGKLYRINYNFAPLWSSSQGYLLRGLGERMYFLAGKQDATLHYRKWSDWRIVLAILISVLSLGSIALSLGVLKGTLPFADKG